MNGADSLKKGLVMIFIIKIRIIYSIALRDHPLLDYGGLNPICIHHILSLQSE